MEQALHSMHCYIAGEVGQVEAHIYGGTFTSVSKVAALIGNDNDDGDKQPAIAYFHGGNFHRRKRTTCGQ